MANYGGRGTAKPKLIFFWASLKYQFKVQIVFVNFALFKRGLEFGGPLHHRDSPPSPSLGIWELGTGLVNFNVME